MPPVADFFGMSIRTVLFTAAAALCLAACEPQAPVAVDPDPEAAQDVGQADPLPQTLPLPSDTTPRFVGLWAASADGCADPAWRFRADGVSTQGEVSCQFNDVELTQTGYTIQATCYAEAPPEEQTIQLSFAESARAMMVSGGPWSPIGLVYCGPLAP